MKDILSYESDIWSCADLLISTGIKQSDFPKHMMPFFALVMLEGRMRNEMTDIEQTEGLNREDNSEEFVEAFKDRDCGYNEYIVKDGKTLSDICNNDKTFEDDFRHYLSGFDGVLKELLGIERGTDDSKFLNLDGIVAELRKKGVLLQYVTKWAQIDLSPYNNSEITTLEEHIKRKWADISAETAGEQYTPEDIIALIAETVTAKINISHDDYVHIYDPTCGGANLLFGVADRLNEAGYKYVAANGSEWNDALFALAKIESLFREEAEVKYGNTLTTLPFKGKEFDVVVANPPYGIPWKGYEKEIRNDQTGQFAFFPSVSDGQLLFLQHNVWMLHENSGIVVEVNNGSSLFSGDAGSGESNIRKYLFDNDWVEAIVQMPSDEFFNTGIVTYLWILNKNKPSERKDKVILINASDLWQPLKKNKGSKRKEMNTEHRKRIVDSLVRFEDNDISKVFDKWHFYFNKQQIQLTEVDKNGRYVSLSLGCQSETFKIKDADIVAVYTSGSWEWPLDDEEERENQEEMVHLHQIKGSTIISTLEYFYWSDDANGVIMRTSIVTGMHEVLGVGSITVTYGRTRSGEKTCTAKIMDSTYKDFEIIPYSPDMEQNSEGILTFMGRYISKPYRLLDNTVGVEVNFNKEFYVPETVQPVDSILAEIAEIDKELANLEKEIGL